MASTAEKEVKQIVTDRDPRRTGAKKAVPNYLRPSTGSCHHACKYGGHHTFEDKEVCKKNQPKPRKQKSVSDEPKRKLIKVRSVSRRRVGDISNPEKARRPVFVDKDKEVKTVEWKDIVAYDAAPLPSDDAPQPDVKDNDKRNDVTRGKKPLAKVTEHKTGVNKQTESLNKRLVNTVRSKLTRKASSSQPQAANGARQSSPSDRTMMNNSAKSTKSAKPPKVKKAITLSAGKKVVGQEVIQRDAITNFKEGKTVYTADQEECVSAESSRPIAVHRRVQSMSLSSRSVRLPFIRQASKNSSSFKLRSKSSKAPILTSEEEKTTRIRFRKGRAAGEESSGGIQLRIRSLRRRGFGGSGGTNTGFVVPEVTLRHQKTLEKKKSRRLYNNMIEETASKLAKSRKSRVKSLVGAFETLISKIGK